MCDMPNPMYNGLINVTNNTAFYKCNVGFVISNSEFENGRKCTKFSEWEGKYEPFCKSTEKMYFCSSLLLSLLFIFLETTCGYPGYIRNGYIIGRSYFYQDKITYKCYDGFDLIGNSTRICREDGNWYPEKPICKGVQCIAFKKPHYAQINIIAENSYEDFHENISQFDSGTQIEIICDENAIISGEKIITCQENGKKNMNNNK